MSMGGGDRGGFLRCKIPQKRHNMSKVHMVGRVQGVNVSIAPPFIYYIIDLFIFLL